MNDAAHVEIRGSACVLRVAHEVIFQTRCLGVYGVERKMEIYVCKMLELQLHVHNMGPRSEQLQDDDESYLF